MCSVIKDLCRASIQRLSASAEACEEFVKGAASKQSCIQPAKDVIPMLMPVIAACHEHLKICTDSVCITASQSCLKMAQKAVEKNTACFDACGGAGSESDCKIVCKDCADACRACLKSFQDYMQKIYCK